MKPEENFCNLCMTLPFSLAWPPLQPMSSWIHVSVGSQRTATRAGWLVKREGSRAGMGQKRGGEEGKLKFGKILTAAHAEILFIFPALILNPGSEVQVDPAGWQRLYPGASKQIFPYPTGASRAHKFPPWIQCAPCHWCSSIATWGVELVWATGYLTQPQYF